MSVEQIARVISEKYRYAKFFQAVGVAGDELVIYLVKRPIQRTQFEEEVRELAGTFPVTFKVTGRIRPAGET